MTAKSSAKSKREHLQSHQEFLATCKLEEKEHYEIWVALAETDISVAVFNMFKRILRRIDDVRLKHVLDNWQNFRAFAARLGKDELDILLLSQPNFGVKSLDELKKAVAEVVAKRQPE